MMRRRLQRMTPAHAPPDRAHGPLPRRLARREEAQDRAGILDDIGVGEAQHRLQHLLLRRLVEIVERYHAVLHVAELGAHALALAMVEIGHHAVVADHRHTPRDVEQLLAQAPHIHVKDHGRGDALLGMRDERVHRAARGRDLDQTLAHCALAAVNCRMIGARPAARPLATGRHPSLGWRVVGTMRERLMSTSSDWEIPQHAQPKQEDWAFDLDRALASVLTLRATVPADAYTAGRSAPSAPATASSSAPTASS